MEEEEMDIDMDRRVSTITNYINFCRDTVIPVRTVRCYPNNKAWITSDIKRPPEPEKEGVPEWGWRKAEEWTIGA